MKDKLDKYMEGLGFRIAYVPIDTGKKQMKRYVIDKCPYSTAISKWMLRLIINDAHKLKDRKCKVK
jgi:hypothetical protein